MSIKAGQIYRGVDRSGRPMLRRIVRIEFCGGQEVVRYVATDVDGSPFMEGCDFLSVAEFASEVRDDGWALQGRAAP